MEPGRGTESEVRDASVAHEVATEIAHQVNAAILRPLVGEIVAGVGFAIVTIALVPLGLLLMVASYLVLAGIFALVGIPSGTVGTIVMVGWLIGTAVFVFVGMRAAFRRLPRRLRTESAAHVTRPEMPIDSPPLRRRFASDPDAGRVRTPSPSLAELDAHLGDVSEPAAAPIAGPRSAD